MMEAATGIIGGLVAGALVTLAGTYYLWVLQRRSKELGYERLSAHVVIPKLEKPTPDIKVLVRESLLDQKGSSDNFVAVDQIRGFRIRVRNTGNEVLQDQRVTFTMDKEARIISVEAEKYPDLAGKTIVSTVQHPTSNVATATIPFLNPGTEIIFSLQSVNNEQERECRVTAGAPGLSYFDMERRRTIWMGIVAFALTATLAVPPGILKLLELGDRISVSQNNAVTTYIAVSLLTSLLLPVITVQLMTSARIFRRILTG